MTRAALCFVWTIFFPFSPYDAPSFFVSSLCVSTSFYAPLCLFLGHPFQIWHDSPEFTHDCPHVRLGLSFVCFHEVFQ